MSESTFCSNHPLNVCYSCKLATTLLIFAWYIERKVLLVRVALCQTLQMGVVGKKLIILGALISAVVWDKLCRMIW
jgi:hypothetical protein